MKQNYKKMIPSWLAYYRKYYKNLNIVKMGKKLTYFKII